MPTGFEPVRETLAECREVGEEFEVAWGRALEAVTKEDRLALEWARPAWQEGYECQSATTPRQHPGT